MKFEKKVKSMTAKEIIMTMVESLKHPVIEIDMSTFGDVEKENGKKVCYGCAATNTICRIAEIEFTIRSIGSSVSRARKISSSRDFLEEFEIAIDSLRKGWISEYNERAKINGFAIIKKEKFKKYPHLTSKYTKRQLEKYIQLAEYQES